MTLEQKIGQLFFIGVSGPALDDGTRRLLSDVNPGGVCLFARNIKSPEQTRKLLDDIREVSPKEPFLSIDQEGGLVDRLRRLLSPMPAANRIKTSQEAAEIASIIASALRLLGFNMNFAPVVDVISDQRERAGNGLFSRGFGRDEKQVIKIAGAFLRSLQVAGIVGCLKHFPGIGASDVDSHEELPLVNVDEREFESVDLCPYQELLKSTSVEMVMIGHAAYPQLRLQESDLDGRLLPSSLSVNFVSTLLRDRLDFQGISITDDLEMGAIVRNYGIGEACKMAIKAGNDMVAICAEENAIREGFEAIVNAVRSGEIQEARVDISLKRIEVLRSRLSEPVAFDIERFGVLSDNIQDLHSRLS